MVVSGGKWELSKSHGLLVVLSFVFPHCTLLTTPYVNWPIQTRPRSKETTDATFKVAYGLGEESGCNQRTR